MCINFVFCSLVKTLGLTVANTKLLKIMFLCDFYEIVVATEIVLVYLFLDYILLVKYGYAWIYSISIGLCGSKYFRGSK